MAGTRAEVWHRTDTSHRTQTSREVEHPMEPGFHVGRECDSARHGLRGHGHLHVLIMCAHFRSLRDALDDSIDDLLLWSTCVEPCRDLRRNSVRAIGLDLNATESCDTTPLTR